jgi:hypothetical protein
MKLTRAEVLEIGKKALEAVEQDPSAEAFLDWLAEGNAIVRMDYSEFAVADYPCTRQENETFLEKQNETFLDWLDEGNAIVPMDFS